MHEEGLEPPRLAAPEPKREEHEHGGRNVAKRRRRDRRGVRKRMTTTSIADTADIRHPIANNTSDCAQRAFENGGRSDLQSVISNAPRAYEYKTNLRRRCGRRRRGACRRSRDGREVRTEASIPIAGAARREHVLEVSKRHVRWTLPNFGRQRANATIWRADIRPENEM